MKTRIVTMCRKKGSNFHYKKIITLALFCIFWPRLSAQNAAIVKEFSLTTDHIPGSDRRNDLNGVPCALIKVYVVDDIERIEGNKIGDVVKKGNVEKWVYMCKGSRNIRIHLKNHLPVRVMFQDYQISGLESNRVYELVIEAPDAPAMLDKQQNVPDSQSPPVRVVGDNEIKGKYDNSPVYSVNKTNSDDNAVLGGLKMVNYRFDYSNMKIAHKDPEKYFSQQTISGKGNHFSSLQSFTEELERVFVNNANSESLVNKGYKLDNSKSSQLVVVIYPLEIDEDGEHHIVGTLCYNEEQVGTVKVHVGGGNNNLFKQLYKRFKKSGEKFGDKLADDILRKMSQ